MRLPFDVKGNAKVTVYSCTSGFFFSSRYHHSNREANNYVTQKTISPPCLGHFLVLPVLPPPLLPPTLPRCTSAPLPHKCLLDRVENSLFISCDFWRERAKAQITFPAVQGYLKVLVLPVSPGHLRKEGGGSNSKMVGRERGKDRYERCRW